MLNEGDSFLVAMDKASSKQNLLIPNQDDSPILHLDPFGSKGNASLTPKTGKSNAKITNILLIF